MLVVPEPSERCTTMMGLLGKTTPLFKAAMGGDGVTWPGGILASTPNGVTLQFTGAHGLTSGRAVTWNGEMRFVTGVVDAQTVVVNAPFTGLPGAGATIGATMNYGLASDLQSASLYDYWSPSTTVHRLLNGVVIDRMSVTVNNDFHEFGFRGNAKDMVDSASFESGQAGLQQFPDEPTNAVFDYSIVPGHLGQVWLGSPAQRFYTLTEASITLQNNIEAREQEFGMTGPVCVTAGQREVRIDFSIFEQDNTASRSLYEAARQRSPIPAMLQLGQQNGALFGIYMNAVVPEVPEFDDREPRLQWKFTGCRAQGTSDDELLVAFG